ncbi:MAG TPA: energy transducer TonB [Acetobacteraceae bacterium]|nr:energy transducer TonB [Acetobacteraceae bacterium]
MTLRRAALLSLALHGFLLLLLTAGGLLRIPRLPEPKPLAAVELVEQNTPTVGPRSAAGAHPAPAKPAPTRTAHAPPLPLPAPRPPPAPPAHHGGTGLVSGPHVIPAALDRAARNIPPAYPPQAAQAGEQGSVILRVAVAPDGTGAVSIAQSSGYALLDNAARTAVARWHFVPARRAGRPVPSTMLIRIRFLIKKPDGGQ